MTRQPLLMTFDRARSPLADEAISLRLVGTFHACYAAKGTQMSQPIQGSRHPRPAAVVRAGDAAIMM